MLRIVFFLILIAAAAFGAAWIADQSGTLTLVWSGWHIETSLPVFAAVLGIGTVVAIAVWSALSALWRMPERLRHARGERRRRRGRREITQGLLAIGAGNAFAARDHARSARRLAQHDPLTLLLEAQSAQLDGDHAGARRAFTAMAERGDTRLLGLRGLFVEAQRADDPRAAVAVAEEALRTAPGSAWASQAVLGFRCSRGDWDGALAIIDNDLASGLIDKATHRRWRGVLLTAHAIESATGERDRARAAAFEAVKLAPTLVPAVALAAKFLSETQQVRRAMRLIETAWLANPHPDLADAYAHVRLGDSALDRLARVEALAAKPPESTEGAIAVARAAIDAREFARARAALAPLTQAPTQRVAMLMAEIAREDDADEGLARSWTLRAVRAAQDPVWTADGYVSERWYPVSPVTGRIDAFQWQAPLAALPGQAGDTIEPAPAGARESAATQLIAPDAAEAPPPPATDPAATAAAKPSEPHDGSTAAIRPSAPASAATPTPPVFRPRKVAVAGPAPVIPIVRAPDDPGVDITSDDPDADPSHQAGIGQAGGWRGFLTRWGG
jgi:HemY protein